MSSTTQEKGTAGLLERVFQLRARGSDVRTELIGGVTMLLAGVYAVAVIPGFLVQAGLPAGPATTAVILVIAVATIAMGIYGNMPFVVAPGLGGAALVAITLTGDGGVPWPTALGMVFWSGIIFLLLTLFGIRELLTRIIPNDIKIAITAGIGMFIALLGFRNSGLVQAAPNGQSLTVGALDSAGGLLALAGLVLITALTFRKIKGAFIITIAVITLAGIPLGVTQLPENWFSLPALSTEVSFQIDLWGSLQPQYLPFVLTLFFAEFFSMTGAFLAVAKLTGLTDKDGNIVNARRPFIADSSAVIGGAWMGVPSMNAYVETGAAGAESGARTGLSSVFAGLGFALLLLFTPIAGMVPGAATAPVLMFIGLSLVAQLKEVNFSDVTVGIPAMLVVACTVFWGNFGTGIASGLVGFVLIKVAAGRWRDVHIGMYILLIPLGYFFWALVQR
ncbi:NCS2 family permease [Lysinibacter sp. HNR]|uniref:NCS2 family permease n=1 Tax=Lysinibacter sp. HNR TaxID=3031408 RepID=UPI002436106C|nr:NCS2 family permease [Lysinibacter sp. HNR]WGD36971.1 NCS2 family permease [Lysinibacter sp. HNR]